MSFQVFREERAVVANFDDPACVLANVPSAFPIGIEQLVGFPHGARELLQLKRLGYNIPSGIDYQYNFPSLYDAPFAHQVTSAAFLAENQHAFCFNDIGTSKTLTALWAADYLMQQGVIRKCLIAAPLSTLDTVWADAFFYHVKHRRAVVLHGSAERRRKLLCQPYDFYIVNHDGVQVIKDELLERTDIDLCIIDEIATYRNWGAHKTKDIHKVIYGTGTAKSRVIPWVWGLTGYPIPNAPTDAWAQCKIITPGTIPLYYSQFRGMVMDQQSQYVYTPRKEALEIVYKAMRPAIRFTRAECLDLPGEVFQTREVTLSPAQKKAYGEITKDLYTKVGMQEILAVNEGVKLSKLLQTALGVVYDAKGAEVLLPQGNRIDVLKEVIEECNEKLIVLAPFRSIINLLQRELSSKWSVAVVHGDVTKNDRAQIFRDFQSSRDPRVLLADPGTMAHGLTLTEASTTVWYGPINSNDLFTQANGRTTRPGQKYVSNIVMLSGTPVERRVYKRLEQRAKVQGALLEMVAAGEALL